MKIQGHQPPGAKELSTGQARSKGVGKESGEGGAARLGGESVKTGSFTLDRIKDRAMAEPDVRADRVAELKAQIKGGGYRVDAEALADKMLRESLGEDA